MTKKVKARAARKKRRSGPLSREQYLDQIIPGWLARLLFGAALVAGGGFSVISGINLVPVLTSKMQPPRRLTLDVSPGEARIHGVILFLLGVWYLWKLRKNRSRPLKKR